MPGKMGPTSRSGDTLYISPVRYVLLTSGSKQQQAAAAAVCRRCSVHAQSVYTLYGCAWNVVREMHARISCVDSEA